MTNKGLETSALAEPRVLPAVVGHFLMERGKIILRRYPPYEKSMLETSAAPIFRVLETSALDLSYGCHFVYVHPWWASTFSTP
jgi:hypothetical protein